MGLDKTPKQTIKGRDSHNCPYLLYVLVAYVVVFYGVWTLWEFWGRPFIDGVIANKPMAQMIKSGVIKNLAWTLPALLLIKHFQSDVFIALEEMFGQKVEWLKYLPIFEVFTSYIFVGSILKSGKLEIVSSFGVEQIIIVLFVGLTEEMVFRGWLLNATVCEEKKWWYILLNAVMFLAIHFPVWTHTETFIANFTGFGFLEIIALSVVFSWAFLKSRSIFVPITLHMYWDLLAFLLIG